MNKKIFTILISGLLLLPGCSANSVSSSSATTKSNESETTTIAETTAVSDTTAKADLILPLTTNDSGKVMIQTASSSTEYPFTSYIITSSKGETVVVDPTMMPRKSVVDLNPAAILSTHNHPDHTDSDFMQAYSEVSKEVLYTKEDYKTKDFHIYTIWSSHSDDVVDETSGNVIVVLEVDGLRIAHFGDCGQTKFTDEQIKALGKIDIAFMQFDNSYSNMDLANEKGFKLCDQINPSIVIPTHFSDEDLTIMEQKYGKVNNIENVLTIAKSDLPATKSVYRITNTHKYQ